MTTEDQEILKVLGGDPRVLALLEIAVTAYKFLPGSLINWKTGKSFHTKIQHTISAFGIPCCPIPWGRFPKRFHKNPPTLQLFKPGQTETDIAEYFDELVAVNSKPQRRAR